MPIPDFGGLPPDPSFTDLTTKINQLVQKLRNLMLNLDSLNVVSLTADNIDAGTIDAGKVTVRVDYNTGAYIEIGPNGMIINDGVLDVFEVTTAGAVTMTKATVQSASGYPKVIMDPAGNLLGVYLNANNYTRFVPNMAGTPGLEFYAGGLLKSEMAVDIGLNDFGFLSRVNAFITAYGFIRFNPIGSVVLLDNWDKLARGTTSSYTTLQTDLNGLTAAINANTSAISSLASALSGKVDTSTANNNYGVSMAFDTGTRNLKLYNTNGVAISTVNIP